MPRIECCPEFLRNHLAYQCTKSGWLLFVIHCLRFELLEFCTNYFQVSVPCQLKDFLRSFVSLVLHNQLFARRERLQSFEAIVGDLSAHKLLKIRNESYVSLILLPLLLPCKEYCLEVLELDDLLALVYSSCKISGLVVPHFPVSDCKVLPDDLLTVLELSLLGFDEFEVFHNVDPASPKRLSSSMSLIA